MAYKKTYRRRRATRRPIRRTRRRTFRKKVDRQTMMVSRELIVPDKFSTLLRYINIDNPVLPSPGVSAYTEQEYRLNGLFDVSPTVASTDIPGFTFIGNLYNSYIAQVAYITCTFMNTGTTPLICGITVFNGDSLTPINWDAYREQDGNQYTRQRVMGPSSGGNDIVTLKMKVRFSSLLGDPRLYNGELNYRGATSGGSSSGANPGVIFPLYVYVLNTQNLALPAQTYPFKLEIKWRCTFFNRLNVT